GRPARSWGWRPSPCRRRSAARWCSPWDQPPWLPHASSFDRPANTRMAIVERELLSTPDRVPAFDTIGWVLRLAAAAVFVAVGLSKHRSAPVWVQMVAPVGLG